MTSLGPKARALIQVGREAYGAKSGDRERIATALRGRLGAAALPPGGSAVQPLGTTGWAVAARVAIGVSVVGGAAFLAARPNANVPQAAAWHASNSSTVVVAPPASETPEAEARAPAALAPATTETAPATPETAAAVSPSSDAPAASSARAHDGLAQEVALLSRATSALRSGHAADALRLLDEHQRRFPNGALSQERRAAKVQALCSLGRSKEAHAELAQLPARSLAAARARQACDSAPSD